MKAAMGFSPWSERKDECVAERHLKPARNIAYRLEIGRTTVKRRSATLGALPAFLPWAEAHGYHHQVAPQPKSSVVALGLNFDRPPSCPS